MTRLNKAFATFFVFCGLVACGPDGGNASTESGPGGSAANAVDGGTQPSAAAKAFIGQWTYISGTETNQCGSAAADTEPVTAADGTVTFSDRSGPDQLVVDDAGCIVVVTVSGTTATGQPGTICPGNFTTSSLVYTLSSGTLREQGSGQIEENGEYCAVSDDAYLTLD
jgi:hypothetical protein